MIIIGIDPALNGAVAAINGKTRAASGVRLPHAEDRKRAIHAFSAAFFIDLARVDFPRTFERLRRRLSYSVV